MDTESLENKPIQTEKARDIDFREIKKSSAKINLKLIIFIILALFAVGALVYFFVLREKPKQEVNKTNSSEKKATVSATPKSDECPDKEFLENINQGYKVCYPKDWVRKDHKVSGLYIGLADKQISGNFPGVFTISISDKSEAQSIEDISENTSKFEYGVFRLDGVKGTQITYTRLRNDALAQYPRAIDTVVAKFGRTYTIGLNSTEADFEANKTLYDTFLSEFKFIDKTANPPWSESRSILVYEPWLNETIKNPVEVSGEAIAFEGTVNIRVKDSDNHTLAETTAQAESGTNRSVFKQSIEFDKPTSDKGTIEVFTISPEDGKEQDKVTIPITFQ